MGYLWCGKYSRQCKTMPSGPPEFIPPFIPVTGMKCSYGKISSPLTEISVAKTEISETEPARPLMWTHRKFYKGFRGEARSRKPGQPGQPGSYEEALNVSLIKELSFWKRSIFFLRDEACLESIKGRQSISVLWLKKQGKNCYSKAQEYDLVFLTALGSRFSTHARHAFVHWKLNLVARVFSFSNMTPFCEPRRPWGRGCWRPHDLLVLVSNTTSSRRIVLRSGTAAQLPFKILFFSRLLPKCTLINLSARNIQIFTN